MGKTWARSPRPAPGCFTELLAEAGKAEGATQARRGIRSRRTRYLWWYVNNCNWKSRTFLKLLKEHNKGGDVLALTWAGNPGAFGSAPVKAAEDEWRRRDHRRDDCLNHTCWRTSYSNHYTDSNGRCVERGLTKCGGSVLHSLIWVWPLLN